MSCDVIEFWPWQSFCSRWRVYLVLYSINNILYKKQTRLVGVCMHFVDYAALSIKHLLKRVKVGKSKQASHIKRTVQSALAVW